MPIEEYEREEKTGGAPFCVEVKSFQRELSALGLFAPSGAVAASKMLAKDEGDPTEGVYTLVTEGDISLENGLFTLTYRETTDAALSESVETAVSFMLDEPGCITVTRRGEVSGAFTLSAGERMYSVYRTPFGAIDMCIYAKKVENRLGAQGGSLVLDYAVELKGMTAQRTKMEIRVKAVGAEN